MVITDLNGNQKTITDIKTVQYNRVNDCVMVTHENVDGELVEMGETLTTDVLEDYIEVTVLGRSERVWTEWYPKAQFIEMNPLVEVD